MSDADITIKPLNDDHRLNIGISLGLSAAINYLNANKEPFEKLPGFNTALALVETLEAQQRAQIAGQNFRAAAAAGFDVRTHMVGLKGRGEIYVKPMDLAERAEFTADADK